jgi:hypothetical protein
MNQQAHEPTSRHPFTQGQLFAGAYVASTLACLAVFPFVPATGRKAVFLFVATITFLPIASGRRRTDQQHRRAWIVLLLGLAAIYVSTALSLLWRGSPVVSHAFDVAGHLLLLSAALTLVLNHGRNNLGVLIDTAVTALAAGGVLWTLLLRPNLPPRSTDWLARLGLLVIILSLLATLGAVIQLDRIRPTSALAEVISAAVFALGGNIVRAIAPEPSGALCAVLLLFVV